MIQIHIVGELMGNIKLKNLQKIKKKLKKKLKKKFKKKIKKIIFFSNFNFFLVLDKLEMVQIQIDYYLLQFQLLVYYQERVFYK
jgi:hypothetical protein